MGEFGAKNDLTDHRTANTIHGFRNIRKELRTFPSYPSDTRRLPCVDVNNPLKTVFKRVCTVYTYLNCMMNLLLYCWQMI